jgi:hypothetical protein
MHRSSWPGGFHGELAAQHLRRTFGTDTIGPPERPTASSTWAATQSEEIAQSAAALSPPAQGQLTGAAICAAAELGQDLLLWSVDRSPGGVATPAAVADHLAGAVGPGEVVGSRAALAGGESVGERASKGRTERRAEHNDDHSLGGDHGADLGTAHADRAEQAQLRVRTTQSTPC